MSIVNDVKRDVRAAKKIRLPWWAVLGLIVGSVPIYWIFDHFGKLDIALPMLVSLGMLGFVIGVKWELRRRAWFWGTIIVLTALHFLLIVLVPWTTKWHPAVTTAAIGSLDVLIMLAILAVVAKLMEGSHGAGS